MRVAPFRFGLPVRPRRGCPWLRSDTRPAKPRRTGAGKPGQPGGDQGGARRDPAYPRDDRGSGEALPRPAAGCGARHDRTGGADQPPGQCQLRARIGDQHRQHGQRLSHGRQLFRQHGPALADPVGTPIQTPPPSPAAQTAMRRPTPAAARPWPPSVSMSARPRRAAMCLRSRRSPSARGAAWWCHWKARRSRSPSCSCRAAAVSIRASVSMCRTAGPHAKVEIMTQPDAPDTGAPFLTGMLDGVPPADAVPLSVEGVFTRGSPGLAPRSATSICGPATRCSRQNGRPPRPRRETTVYAVPNTPVILLSVNGRTVSAELKD